MGFEGLTSGERKRLQQGIISPQEAELISARAVAKGGGGGFWTSTWGTVLRAVGIAALNFIPVVGSVASTAVGAYDKQRFAELRQKAVGEYQVKELEARQRAVGAPRTPAPTSEPFLSTSPYPWLPDYGNIGMTGGYAGGVVTVGGSAAPSGPADPLEEVKEAFARVTPAMWATVALVAVGIVTIYFLFIRR